MRESVDDTGSESALAFTDNATVYQVRARHRTRVREVVPHIKTTELLLSGVPEVSGDHAPRTAQ